MLIEDPLDFQDRHLAVDLFVDGYDRGQGAAAQTSHPVEVVFPIGCGFPGAGAEALLGGYEDLLSAPDVAGRSQADAEMMPARRMETELGVKSRYPEDLVLRDLEPAGGAPDGLPPRVALG